MDEKTKLLYILKILQVTGRRFFELLKEYRKDPDNFSIQYERKRATRKTSENVERNIINGPCIYNNFYTPCEVSLTNRMGEICTPRSMRGTMTDRRFK